MRNTILAAAFTALAAPALACGDVGVCTAGFNDNVINYNTVSRVYWKDGWMYFQVQRNTQLLRQTRPMPRPHAYNTHSIKNCNNTRCTKAVAGDPLYYDRGTGSWATGTKLDYDGDVRPCGGNSPYGAC